MSIILNPQIRKSIIALTDANIKALPTTPITLVAAPGSGFKILPHIVHIQINDAAGVYTNINATYAACFLYYLGDTSQWTNIGIVDDSVYTLTGFTSMFAVAGIHSKTLPPYTDTPTDGNTGVDWVSANTIGSTLYDNKALAIAMDNNGSGVLTGGNAANSGKVTIYYTIEAL